jgi:hypothetical protein
MPINKWRVCPPDVQTTSANCEDRTLSWCPVAMSGTFSVHKSTGYTNHYVRTVSGSLTADFWHESNFHEDYNQHYKLFNNYKLLNTSWHLCTLKNSSLNTCQIDSAAPLADFCLS